MVGGTAIPFLVDSGATHSTVPQPPKGTRATKKQVHIVGVDGKRVSQSFLTSCDFEVCGTQLHHEFLLTPTCPIALLGRDVLCKLQATLEFSDKGVKLTVPKGNGSTYLMALMEQKPNTLSKHLPECMLAEVDESVWAEEGSPGLVLEAIPASITVKPGKGPIRIRQYPLSMEGRRGLQPVITQLLKEGRIEPCQSPWNSPILAVPKGMEKKKWRLVQDLRAINAVVNTRHSVVPNPYNILATIPGDHEWFTALDLKDAFFSIPVHPDSRELFAFEWEDPDTGRKAQYTWTVLPQGFVDSPTLFSQELGRTLSKWKGPEGTSLLQYIDDLLISGNTEQVVEEATISLLNFLGTNGYRVAKEKAQLVTREVRYLGYLISHGQRQLDPGRKEAICRIPCPQTKRQLRAFLGMAGFCRVWIPGFGQLTKPLHAKCQESEPDSLQWEQDEITAFEQVKKVLMEAPALGLPDLQKSFHLFVHEMRGVMSAVLTQKLGPDLRPVAYFSRQLDTVAQGWPTCVRAVAATAMAVEEARKFTLENPMHVYCPHMVCSLLQQRGSKWLTSARMAKYEALLFGREDLTFESCNRLNPATLLPDELESSNMHECLEVVDSLTMARADLLDTPLDNPDMEIFIDGSSRVIEGKRKTGYAVTTLHELLEAEPLPSTWSAQAAELYALRRALILGRGQRVTIYTDSKYAFGVCHAHGALWKERGFLTANGDRIAHSELVLELLEALLFPKQVAIVHVKAHQRGKTPEVCGNNMADEAAKQAALKPLGNLQLALIPSFRLPPSPQYTKQEEQEAITQGASKNEKGWWMYCGGKILVPHAMLRKLLWDYHQSTHNSGRKMVEALTRHITAVGLHQTAEQIVQACPTCQRVNAKTSRIPRPGARTWVNRPFQSIQVDFTELPRQGRYRYLLVLVDKLTGWPEAFPCASPTAKQVAKVLLHHIIPRFGTPEVINSDRGTHFVNQIIQQVSLALGISWDLHTAWRPQASGQVERLNRSLKTCLTKICMDTKLHWPEALPIALTRLRATPKGKLGLSPFELLYGMPYPIFPKGGVLDFEIGDIQMKEHVIALQSVLHSLHRAALVEQPLPYDSPVHSFLPGDWVYVKKWKHSPLTADWEGPKQVLLTSHSSAKVEGHDPWIHHTRLKKASAPEILDEAELPVSWTVNPISDLKFLFRKVPR
ncbi:protein NYNRIN-like [Eublepharis macularius]|uniref:Gag-Pol polyprotein n=1 Tax=Eublepharis macularius TaxID=481883 RepID=A0AA97IYY5_EUBMA|nr:protein NYNRIN-like [Eublepharis macularius]